MNDSIIALGALVAAFLIGVVTSGMFFEKATQKEAIALGFAHYNPTNGVWEWKK